MSSFSASFFRLLESEVGADLGFLVDRALRDALLAYGWRIGMALFSRAYA